MLANNFFDKALSTFGKDAFSRSTERPQHRGPGLYSRVDVTFQETITIESQDTVA